MINKMWWFPSCQQITRTWWQCSKWSTLSAPKCLVLGTKTSDCWWWFGTRSTWTYPSSSRWYAGLMVVVQLAWLLNHFIFLNTRQGTHKCAGNEGQGQECWLFIWKGPGPGPRPPTTQISLFIFPRVTITDSCLELARSILIGKTFN